MPFSPANRGFTLVELAISLTIIGLLLGGVLKGVELVENARITKTVKQINDYEAAVTVFRNIYNNQLPGDMSNPAGRLPNCTTAPCNNTVGIGTRQLDTVIKNANFWRHLQRAGLITGINEAGDNTTISPQNPFGGYVGISYQNIGKPAPEPYLNRFYISDPKASTNRIGPIRAAAIDAKIDDGMPRTGEAQTNFTSSGTMDLCHHATTLAYLTTPSLNCVLYIVSTSANY